MASRRRLTPSSPRCRVRLEFSRGNLFLARGEPLTFIPRPCHEPCAISYTRCCRRQHTEREGFEPPTRGKADTRFRVARLRPLGHLSQSREQDTGHRKQLVTARGEITVIPATRYIIMRRCQKSTRKSVSVRCQPTKMVRICRLFCDTPLHPRLCSGLSPPFEQAIKLLCY